MLEMDCLRTEIGTEEILAIDYCHLHLLNFWQPRLQPRRLYVVEYPFAHFGLIIKFVPSTELVLPVESVLVVYYVRIFN